MRQEATVICEFNCLDDVNEFIQRYIEHGGSVEEVVEGNLGYGTLLLKGEGLKSFIIREVYQNCWSSKHILQVEADSPNKDLKANTILIEVKE